MAIVKKVISYILAVILSICMISAILLGCISSSLLNKSNIKKELRETNYYYYLYDIILESCNNYVLQSGFEESVFDNIITEQGIEDDVDELVNGLYDQREINLSTDDVRQRLEANIQKEIAENGYVINEEIQADIDTFEDTVITIYTNNMLYSENVISKLSTYLKKAKDISRIAMIVLWVVSIILLVILFKLNTPAIGIGLGIAGIFFVVVKEYSGTNIAINNILLFNWAFSKSMAYILNQMLQKMFTVGVVLTLLGVVVIILAEYRKVRKEFFKHKMLNPGVF